MCAFNTTTGALANEATDAVPAGTPVPQCPSKVSAAGKIAFKRIRADSLRVSSLITQKANGPFCQPGVESTGAGFFKRQI